MQYVKQVEILTGCDRNVEHTMSSAMWEEPSKEQDEGTPGYKEFEVTVKVP